ncbi:MAG: hypothetical protein RL308_1097 [Bacteroidota bacterium]|jgi:hypothetical protein
MLDKITKEKDEWICLNLKVNLNVYQVRFKNKKNGLYRTLSSSNHRVLGKSNFEWFRQSFLDGFYRQSIMDNYVQFIFFLKVSDLNKINTIKRELKLRVKKMGCFDVEIEGINSMGFTDFKLLSSRNGMNAYQKILKSYRG